MEAAQHKINAAIDRLRTLTLSALDNESGETVAMKDWIEAVSNVKAVRAARGHI